MVGTNRDVAIFTGAERIICAVYGLVIPIVNAVYPYLSSKASDNIPLLLRMFNRLFLYIVGGFTFVSVVAFFSSSFLVKLVLGSEFMASVEVLRILSFLPLIVAINTAINVLLLLPMNLDKLRTAIIAIGGVVNLFLCILLTKKFSFIGTSISYVVSQFLVAVISIGVYIKLRIKYQDQA
jgi:PST family polysaccharide transporter